jgi:hypothetical protein
MRSIDLYNNNIDLEVNALQKLKQFTLLHQVLLQNNRLHGTITAGFFAGWPQSWQTLNLGLNRDITGCLHPRDIPNQLETFTYGGTGLAVSEACESHGGGPGRGADL